MNSFLMWAAGLLAAVLAALFAVPYFVDWNGYRGVFEEEASRILGRSVRVGGDVNLRLLPSPYVRFEKLRIADSSGLTGEPFFRAESFTMWLAVPPMLKGILEAEKIELDRPVLRLAVKKDGVGNWSGFSARSGSLPFVPSGVALDSVNIVDGILSFDVEGGGRLGEVDRINGELNASSLSGPYSYRGSVRRGRLPLNLVLATTENDGSGDVRLKIRASSPKTSDTYTFDGRVTGLDGQPKIIGTVNSDLAVGGGWRKGSKTAVSGTVLKVGAQLTGDTKGAVLKDIFASFDSVGQPQDIVGEARVSWGARHRVEAELSAKWLDLDQLFTRGVFTKSAHAGAQDSSSSTASPPGDLATITEGSGATGSSAPDAGVSDLLRTKVPANAADGQVNPPWQTARRLVDGLGELLPGDVDLNAKFLLDQANLGGDSVSAIQLVLSRDGGPLSIESLRARLPGSARLEFSGVMVEGAQASGVKGEVYVGGPSVARIKSWAFDTGGAEGSVRDGSFSISGNLELGENSAALKQARAEFSDALVQGEVSWSGSKGRLAIDLSGQEIDGSWIGLKPLVVRSLIESLDSGAEGLKAAVFGGAEDSNMGESSGKASVDPTNKSGSSDLESLNEFSIRIKAGKLQNGDEVLRNVDARILMVGQKVSIPALSFETVEGLEIQLDGEISSVDQSAQGEIHWVASARDARAAKPLVNLLNAGSSVGTGFGDLVGEAAPFRVAGKIDLGGRQVGAADFEIDGEVRGSRLVAHMLFDGGLDSWKTKPADITVTVDSARWREALNLLALGEGMEVASLGGDMPMRGVFKAVGLPSSGMKAMGLARSEQLTLIYNGLVNLGASSSEDADVKSGGITATNGEIVVAAAHARDVLGLLGMRVGAGIETARVDGLVDLKREGDKLVFRPRDLKFGASTMAGRIELGHDDDGIRTIDADLIVDKAQMISMMSVLLGGQGLNVRDGVGAAGDGDGTETGEATAPKPKPARSARAVDPGEGVPGAASAEPALAAGVRRNTYMFSQSPFDLSLLSKLRGRIVTRIGSLGVGSGLVVSGAQVETTLKPEHVDVVLSKGRAIEGDVTGRATFEKGLAGVGLTGGFTIENASLSALTRWDETGAAIPMASGSASMKLDFSGRALTPRSVVSLLTGKGEVVLKDTLVKGLGPGIVTTSADEVIARDATAQGGEGASTGSRRRRGGKKARDAADRADLEGALKERLGEGELKLGSRTIDIKVVDGAARLAPFSMKNSDGVTTGRVTIDIGQLAVDSDFKLTANGKRDQKPLPPVSVVFVGPLGKIGAIPPLVSLGALERELAVRRLEQNVSELERLRRLDEEAAKRRREREEERVRELEAARAAAVEEEQALEAPPALEPGAGGVNGVDSPQVGNDGTPADLGVVPPNAGGAAAPVEPSAKAVEKTGQSASRARARRLRSKKRRTRPRGRSVGEILQQQF